MGEVAGQVLFRVRQPVAERDRGGGHAGLAAGGPPVGPGRGLPEVRRRPYRARGDVPEMALDEPDGGVRVDVTGDGEHRVARRVVGLEELGAVVRRGAAQQGHVPVAVVRVGEGVVEHAGQQRPGEPPYGRSTVAWRISSSIPASCSARFLGVNRGARMRSASVNSACSRPADGSTW